MALAQDNILGQSKNILPLYDNMPQKILTLALLFLLPLASASVFSNQHLPKTLIMALLAAIAIGDWLQNCWRHKRLRWSLGGINCCWLLFLIWICLSSAIARDWTRVGERLGYWSLLLVLHLWFASRPLIDLAHCLWALVLAGTLAAVYGLYQSLAPGYVNTYPTFVATFGNVNFAAAYMALVLPLALHCGPRRPAMVWIARPLACALLFSYLIRTGSRAAWLATLVGFMVYGGIQLITLRKLPKLKKMLTMAALAVVIVVLPLSNSNWRHQVSDRIGELKNFDRGSVKVRRELWRGTLAMIAQRPSLGVGPGQFAHHFYRYRDPKEYSISQGRLVDHPHNSWLLIASESGIPAALALVTMLMLSIRAVWRQARLAPKDYPLPLPALLAVLASLSMISLVSSPLLSPASAIFLVIISGWAARQSLSPCREIALGSSGRCLVVSAGIVATSLLLQAPIRHIVADTQALSGQRHLKQGRPFPAIAKLSRAVMIYPESLYQVELARALLAAKDYLSAREAFTELRRRAPELENAHVDLGLCYIERDREYQALKIWNEAYHWFPASVILNSNLARLVQQYALAKELFLLEHRSRAFTIFEKPAGATVTAECSLQTGLAHEAVGNLRKALVCYIDAQNSQKLQAVASLQIALIMHKLGLEASALHHFMQAASHGDNKIAAAAYCALGSIYQSRQSNWPSLIF